MRAAYIEKPGSADNIIVGELPKPEIGADQVLVKVSATTVDPIDTYIRSGAYKIDLPEPFIIGRDMVGTVEQVGSSVSSLKPGQKVWCNNQGYAGRQGTFAEYLAIDSELVYPLPGGADPINLLASVHSALTACVGLIGKADVKEKETIFINGGSGNVGQCAIQLCKHMGARVAVTAGSEDKEQRCRESGADLVINYKRESLGERIQTFAPEGVNVFWDLTQKPAVPLALNVVSRRGRILLSSGLKQVSEFNVGQFYTRNCTMFGFTITDLSVDELKHYAGLLNSLFAGTIFRSHIALTMSLAQAAESHRLLESGVDGKIIIRINE